MRSPRNLRKTDGVRFAGPVTLRPGVTRRVGGKTYKAGRSYEPDDPGVMERPDFFVLVTRPKDERRAPRASRGAGPAPEPPSIVEQEEPREPLGEAGDGTADDS